MKHNMKVSVIIPAYNAADTIHEPLDSLLAQTEPHWEAIIVDDGSQDNTAVIVQNYIEQDGRFHYIHQQNGGVCAARNTGLDHTHYDWLLYLDADDWIDPTFIEKLTAIAKDDPTVDIVHCGWAYILPDGRQVDEPCWQEEGDVFHTLAITCFLCIHSAIVRKTAVQAAGGFDTNFSVCGDWDFWLRTARVGAKYAYTCEILAHYLIRAGSMFQDGIRFFNDGLRVLDLIHAPDERVQHPIPAYANGLPQEQFNGEKILGFLTWVAGLMIGSKQDYNHLFNEVEGIHAPQLSTHEIAQLMARAPIASLHKKSDSWVELYPQLQPEIQRFFERLEKQSQAPIFAKEAMLHLEQAILDDLSTETAVTIGKTHRAIVDITQKLPNLTLAEHVEKVLLHITVKEEPICKIELPVIGGLVPDFVIAAAIAEKEAWEIMKKFFHATAYQKSGTFSTPERELDWADPNIHDKIGWLYFMRQLWKRPSWQLGTFYDPDFVDETAVTQTCNSEWVHIEISQPLPNLTIADDIETVNLFVTYSGALVSLIPIVATKNGITAQAIRVAINSADGDMLYKTAVRQSMIGYEWTTAEFTTSNSTPIDFSDDNPFIISPHSQHIINHFQAISTTAVIGNGYNSPIGTTQPTLLPTSTYQDFSEFSIAKMEQQPDYLLYLPDIIKKEPLSPPSNGTLAKTTSQKAETTSLSKSIKQLFQRVLKKEPTFQTLTTESNYITEKLPILMYHSIAPTSSDAFRPYRVTPEMFEQQLRLLRDNDFYAISFEQWHSTMKNKKPLPGRAVLLTFDDGYLDFYEYAAPLLKKYGLTATVFLVSGHIGDTNAWDAAYFKALPLMNWAQILELQKEGIHFGSHFVTHSHLPTLSPAEVVTEAMQSRLNLSEKLGTPVNSLAYPYGGMNQAVAQLMGACGYTFGVTVEHGYSHYYNSTLALPRIDISGHDTITDFAEKLGVDL